MNIQPWYRLRRIDTELELEEGVGDEPPEEERVDSVPGLYKKQSDALG
jgi:hypothetical protein